MRRIKSWLLLHARLLAGVSGMRWEQRKQMNGSSSYPAASPRKSGKRSGAASQTTATDDQFQRNWRACRVCPTRMCDDGMDTCHACADGDTVSLHLGVCDRHSSAKAAALWERDAQVITLCAHCYRIHGPKLRAEGWDCAATNLTAWQTQAPANA